MKQRALLILLAAIWVSGAIRSFAAGEKVEPTVSYEGFGALKFGMTVAEASKALGVKLKYGEDSEGTPKSECSYVVAEKGLEGISFMTSHDKIMRIDVEEPTPHVATSRGATVGMSEANINELYNGKVVTERHAYEDPGHYLIVTPGEAKSAKFGIVFETNGEVVTRYRAGLAPFAFYVEGCS